LSEGLDERKIVIANCAVDNDCILDNNVIRDQKTVVLASKFGPRKGAELLPDILLRLQDWNFILMGRGWDEFLKQKNLQKLSNFNYVNFNKNNRTKFFSMAKIFLSLSNLEGGPVPLIESMSLGVIPISTSTGFAPEFIKNGVNGFLLPINPSAALVESRIKSIDVLNEKPEVSVSHLTWDRIAKITLIDFMSIKNYQ
jgi:glycosyltransferase involved in cell wall biosynthesis